MNTYQFKCQRFWLRVFSAVPVILLLAYLEYIIFEALLGDSKYFELSYLLFTGAATLILGQLLFRYTGKPFVYSAQLTLDQNELSIRSGRRQFTVPTAEITLVDYQEIRIYAVKVGMLTVCAGKRTCKLYSKDIVSRASSAEMRKAFAALKPFSKEDAQ